MSYAFDPELAPAAARMAPLDYADPVAARAALRRIMAAQPGYPAPDRVRVLDRRVPGGPAVRIYRPVERPGPLPALLFPHWGGFVTGDLDTARTASMRIADEVGAVVLSPEYRLAPEHPYPAGLDDCDATLHWAHASAAELDIDPERIGVGGFSAGGGLAAGVALRARERSGPSIRALYLLFPQLDDRLATPSARSFVDTPMLDRANLELSWRHYLGPGPASATAAPARHSALAGLPPTFVGVCQYDPLRDEGLLFGHRLIQAGVPTELVHYPGTFHGCIGITSAAVSRRMAGDQVRMLRAALASC